MCPVKTFADMLIFLINTIEPISFTSAPSWLQNSLFSKKAWKRHMVGTWRQAQHICWKWCCRLRIFNNGWAGKGLVCLRWLIIWSVWLLEALWRIWPITKVLSHSQLRILVMFADVLTALMSNEIKLAEGHYFRFLSWSTWKIWRGTTREYKWRLSRWRRQLSCV